MREILFRGKRKDNGEWVEGAYHTNQAGNAAFILIPAIVSYHPNREEIIVVGYEVIPSTVGQFTGLLDKNKKKIFEGDVDKDGIVIAWNQDDASFIGEHPDECHCLFETSNWFEIAGNKWDNPELLQEATQ